jgi:hypothetical protein
MKYRANQRHGSLLGVLATAAALVGCTGDGSSATTAASGAPAAITTGIASLPSSSGRNATLSWTAPTANTDGSVLVNLGGYVIHYGTVANNLTSSITISNPGLTTYVVENLPAGTYFFTLSAATVGGVKSVDSNEASITIS